MCYRPHDRTFSLHGLEPNVIEPAILQMHGRRYPTMLQTLFRRGLPGWAARICLVPEQCINCVEGVCEVFKACGVIAPSVVTKHWVPDHFSARQWRDQRFGREVVLFSAPHTQYQNTEMEIQQRGDNATIGKRVDLHCSSVGEKGKAHNGNRQTSQEVNHGTIGFPTNQQNRQQQERQGGLQQGATVGSKKKCIVLIPGAATVGNRTPVFIRSVFRSPPRRIVALEQGIAMCISESSVCGDTKQIEPEKKGH